MTDRKSILLVEDEVMIAMMLEDFLDSLGYATSGIAASVVDGCALVAAGGFDAAILDCNLHGEKVWPVADALRAKGIPFVFATGGDTHALPVEYAENPAISKPFTLAGVENALRSILP